MLLGVEADNEGGDVDDLQHGAREGGTCWVRSRGVLPRMRTRHQTRVASVSCFMTVAGHVDSKFDVVHASDLLDTKEAVIIIPAS